MIQHHNHNEVHIGLVVIHLRLYNERQDRIWTQFKTYKFITIPFTGWYRLCFGDTPSPFLVLACNVFLSFIQVSHVLWIHWTTLYKLYLLFITFLYCNLACQAQYRSKMIPKSPFHPSTKSWNEESVGKQIAWCYLTLISCLSNSSRYEYCDVSFSRAALAVRNGEQSARCHCSERWTFIRQVIFRNSLPNPTAVWQTGHFRYR